MKKIVALTSLTLVTALTAFSAPTAMRIKILNSEILYKASVTTEQMQKNIPTLHIYQGKIVDRESAKNAFLNGETSCRVFLDGHSSQVKENRVIDLVMEIPTQNKKMLAFASADQKDFIGLTCQSSNEISHESILKALGSLVEVVK